MENKPLCPQGREGGENCVCKATILQKQNKTNQLRWARSHTSISLLCATTGKNPESGITASINSIQVLLLGICKTSLGTQSCHQVPVPS